MNDQTITSSPEHLKTPIAIVNEHGDDRMAQRRLRSDLRRRRDGVADAGRARGGRRARLAAGLLPRRRRAPLASTSSIEGRTYRVDKIMQVDDYGDAAPWRSAFEDVTRQREAEQAKSDFTAQIVHDLRGPLSGIQGTLEFVLSQEGVEDRLAVRRSAAEAQRESERMMSLINEILDFSKIQSGSFAVEQEPVRMAGLLKRAVRSLQTVASRDEVFLLSAHGRDVPQIIGSVEKLTQAVINLISNSLKFTPKKGLISVGAQIVRNGDVPEAIVITVTDSGMGIKADGAAADLGQVQADRQQVAPRRRRHRPRPLHREAGRRSARRRSDAWPRSKASARAWCSSCRSTRAA